MCFHNAHDDARVVCRDDCRAGRILYWIELDTKMLESLVYFRTYDRRTFAHAAGEDEGVQIPEHGDERSDIFFRLINEQFNGLSRRHVGNTSLQERPHVGAYLRDAEMGRPIGADMFSGNHTAMRRGSVSWFAPIAHLLPAR